MFGWGQKYDQQVEYGIEIVEGKRTVGQNRIEIDEKGIHLVQNDRQMDVIERNSGGLEGQSDGLEGNSDGPGEDSDGLE